ncbi:hypothetical protein M3Y97_00521500 [Aphelenchoides bicaudatus]|nr:hypothetical protein M3Y97_00521500 [Aphelenchoides bicaudatus]
MRIPTGAPSYGFLWLQQRFPSLKKYKFRRPPNGTLFVFGFLGFTSLAVLAMFGMPKYYNEYYRQIQTEKRALIGATNREQLAGGLRPWSDPFEREKKKNPPSQLSN